MTKLQIVIPGLLAMSLQKADDEPPPSFDAEVEGEEVSRIVETLRPGLAKAKPRGAYELPRRKVGVR